MWHDVAYIITSFVISGLGAAVAGWVGYGRGRRYERALWERAAPVVMAEAMAAAFEEGTSRVSPAQEPNHGNAL